MPTYEFKCSSCESTLEVKVPISEDVPNQRCETCGKEMVRIYKLSGIQFKGSGFYVTDE